MFSGGPSTRLRPTELENKRCFRPTATMPQGAFTTDYTFTVCFKNPYSFSIQYFVFVCLFIFFIFTQQILHGLFKLFKLCL